MSHSRFIAAALAVALAAAGLAGCTAAEPPLVGITLPGEDERWGDHATDRVRVLDPAATG